MSGAARGLAEIDAIADCERLAGYPFYFAARGELELRTGRRRVAREQFITACSLARNSIERRFFERRAEACATVPPGDERMQ